MPDDSHVPSWNGDPATFESFAQNCRWYEMGLKPTERSLAASRVWQRLDGAAKSVVRHLAPTDFDSATGLTKLLDILRASPLQQLPIPDSFGRLEKWSSLRRGPQESIPQLLVREEERFVELQQALKRARAERVKTAATSTSIGPEREMTPPISPSRSPGAGLPVPSRGEVQAEPMDAAGAGSTLTIEKDFFSDELRGYRLLKAARLGTRTQERQHILTLTANSTRFEEVRRALRTLYADDKNTDDAGAPGFRSRRTVWWAEEDWHEGHEDEGSPQWNEDWGPAEDDGAWAEEMVNAEAYGEWQDEWSWEDPAVSEDLSKDDTSDLGSIPEKERYEEAYTLHQEAAKTLQEARQAVAKVRAARGYYDTAGLKGSAKGYRQPGKGKCKGASKGKRPFGPCFICGSRNHSYEVCPDRHSPHGGQPSRSPSGSPKGKGKRFKGKPQVNYYYDYFVDIEKYQSVTPEDYMEKSINVMSLEEDTSVNTQNVFKVIVDTGATESVCGVNSMARMMDSLGDIPYEVKLYDRPSFRFGNGFSQRARSRVDVKSKAMGWISFYLLDGSAQETPPLLGGRELHERRAIVAYNGDFLPHRDDEYTWWTSRLYHLRGRHVAIDLSEKPRHLHQTLHDLQHPPDDSGSPDGDGPGGSGDHDGRDSDRSRSRPSTGSQPGVHELVRQASLGGGVHSVERISEAEEEVQNRQRSPRADVSASSCMSFGSVLMVAEDVHAPVHEGDARQQLQQLAQRLSNLRDRIHGNGSPGGSRARSTAERMAMRRSPSPRTRKEQSICSVAKLQEMRPSSQLCHKDQRPWGNEILGTTSLLGGASAARAASGLCPGRDEREDLQRQGDGAEGSPVGGQSWAGQHVDPDQSMRPDWSKDSGQGDHYILDKEHGCHHNSSPEIDKKHLSDSGGTENSQCDAKRACCEGEGKSILNASSGAGDCGGRRVAAGRDGGSRGLDGLWASLKALRERMSLGGSNAERLEADRHQSQPTKEAQHFHSKTFEAVPASTNSIAADILSVKNSFTREILPPLAKRLAKAAALTSVLMAPVYELVNAVESKIDMMEIACSPTLSLTSAFEADGFTCFRVNHLSDFNLDTQKGTTMLKEKIQTNVPKLAWVSLPCTRLSALQLLTPRDEEAWSRFEKKRGQDLRRASEVADALEPVIAETDFAWEWPITAVAGWRSRAIEKLEKLAKKHNRTIYRIRIDGCAYGLQWRGVPLRKGWQS